MSKKALLLSIFISHSVLAAQMGDFIKDHYDNGGSETQVSKVLTPTIVVGNELLFMNNQRLDDVKNITQAVINKTDRYKWLCVTSKEGVSYGFISDNKMDKDDITAIALLKGDAGCSLYNGDINVSINNVPLITATPDTLTRVFGKTATAFDDETAEGTFVQANAVQYFISEHGVLLSKVTPE